MRPCCTAPQALKIMPRSSSAIAISLAFQGLLNAHYAVVFAPACFLGSLLGAQRHRPLPRPAHLLRHSGCAVWLRPVAALAQRGVLLPCHSCLLKCWHMS